MSLVRQDLKGLLVGLSPNPQEQSTLPQITSCIDLLPTAEGLKAIAWEVKPLVGNQTRGPVANPLGPARTPEGDFYISEEGELYLEVGSTKMFLGSAIECTDILTFKGCIGVLNPGGVGGLLVYPPHKYPVSTERLGPVDPLGFAALGKADTNGCVFFGTGELGLLMGIAQHQTYLVMFCERGVLGWNLIYDFNNFLGSYSCLAGDGSFETAFFLGKDGALYSFKELKIERLGFEKTFKGRDMHLWFEVNKGILFLRDKTTNELWLFKSGLMKASILVLRMGWDHTLGKIWLQGLSGTIWYFDDIDGIETRGFIGTNFWNMGVPGPKRFATVSLFASGDVAFQFDCETEYDSFTIDQRGQDFMAPIDREACKLRLQITPEGLKSGELIQSSMMLYKPLDRRLLNDVVSNG